MQKNIIKILVIILLIAVFIYLLWTFFVPKPKVKLPEKEVTPGENQLTISEGLPLGTSTATTSEGTAGVGNQTSNISTVSINKISTNPALGYWISPPTGEVKYISVDGTVWGTATLPNKQLSSQKINGIKDIIPYKDGSKVLVSYETANGLRWLIYDSLDDTWNPLPEYVKTAFWGESNEKIFAITKEKGNHYNLSSLDLSKAILIPTTLIANFNFPDAYFRFIPPQTVIIMERPSFLYKSAVWLLNLKTKTLDKIIEEKNGLFAKLADDEKTLIYSAKEYDAYTFIVDINTLTKSVPRFFASADKCNTPLDSPTSSPSLVFCFGSSNISDFSRMPDEYLQSEFLSNDNLYSYNRENDTIASLLISGTPLVETIDGTDLKIIENKIYFINRFNNNIYRLILPQQQISPN